MISSDLANPTSSISDLDMERRLADVSGETSKMILFWIELHRRESGNIDVDALEYKFTLEHIMPIKWSKYWSDVPIKERGVILPPDSKEGIQLSDDDILCNILTYPFKRFADIGAVSYDKSSHEISINQPMWTSFSEDEKKEILDVCNRKLKEYFSTLETKT